jgi:hypothetical protein
MLNSGLGIAVDAYGYAYIVGNTTYASFSYYEWLL